ncbi:mpv17-like protein 2 [Chrysoperla carnea]|uniref:mpv17-like protein 2 n=1 Tax=Chrysoperla carnea TaxID=189513 RepID=UPI001D085BDA|nr:mpv17-like protein 2 [Chrysoperla carnea]
MNVFRIVKNGFRRHLFLSNTISSAALMSIGDMIEQFHEIQKSQHSFDWLRNFRMTLVGVGMGCINHYYYTWIDRMFKDASTKHAMIKVVADQLLASPMCIAFLFYFDGFLLRQNLQTINEEMGDKFFTIYTADWCFWPPLQYINFKYVHHDYRVVYLNTIQMFYNIILTHLKYNDIDDTDKQSKDVEPIVVTRFVSLEGYMEGYHNIKH